MPLAISREFYIVGAFEGPHIHYFPTHLQPIIAERTPLGFRRWSYAIKNPYEICPCIPVGLPRPLVGLFPVRSFLLFDTPIPLNTRSQLVALGPNEFIISSSRLSIILWLTRSVLARFRDSQYRKRAWTTIWNSIS